ncbi:hypothetical protein QMT40_000309 [Parvibaculaceae bacterium PLY_AMNH_Bact1]|nr:hypothetical protein QMT40_000309 [Parvibaculaceae bacterium PLY_AMNH_Bact1]
MRLLLTLISGAFALAALSAGLYDLLGAPARSGLFHTGGEVWFALSPDSLNLMQAITQRYVSPELWDPTIVAVLKLPAIVSLGLPAVVLGAYPLMRALNSRPS